MEDDTQIKIFRADSPTDGHTDIVLVLTSRDVRIAIIGDEPVGGLPVQTDAGPDHGAPSICEPVGHGYYCDDPFNAMSCVGDWALDRMFSIHSPV